MNIWYFHHYGTPYEIPGLHRPFEFGEYFCKDGDNVAVFTSSYLHYSGDNMICGKEKHIVKEYDRVKAVFVRTCGYENKIKRVLNMVQFGARLKFVSEKFAKGHFKPDIIVASSPHPLTMLAGLKIAKKMGVPCVCEVRDFWPEVFFLGGVISEKGLVGKLLLRYERKIYEKADSLVFLKEGDHTYITDHGWDIENGGGVDMSKCSYVNNGVDLQLFDRRKNECVLKDADLENEKFKVVYCGTIRPINNVDTMLDVAKLADDETEFLVYGDGNCVAALKERIEKENIKNVKLKGFVANQYVPYILSRANVNILNYAPSGYNWTRGNSSNKLFEYLASGRPVVSTVKMGYDIIEKNSAGFCADECCAEKIWEKIEKIKSLSRREYDKMCLCARETAACFDIPYLSKKYSEILVQTINKYKTKSEKNSK